MNPTKEMEGRYSACGKYTALRYRVLYLLAIWNARSRAERAKSMAEPTASTAMQMPSFPLTLFVNSSKTTSRGAC